ncbi:uncharacterized protein LOC110093189 [Dendrobium catenatum]|uniref:RanBP2-type domain-containing protein n=1 Tax=Dendrobium catenatum TaxID=906689 RepID=A0A2I0VXA8_9ASPA|nr:uncharacterized protein LOC110093189 [Dendrobium catenatum]PKU68051.1 hypothetical protein MA16_Dca022960 [Dendrobium catenatum]
MDRISKMRSRELDLDAAPESESEALSLSPSPAPRIGANLSSMVVKPSASDGGGSDLDIGYATDEGQRGSPPPPRRINSPQDPQPRDSPSSGRRRVGFSPMHRRRSPDGFRPRVSQPGPHHRGSPLDFHRRGSPLAFHPRSQRFRNDPGYMQRPGSISPPRRLRGDDGYYEPDFGHPRGPRSGRGRGVRGRGGGRFRDISPPAFGSGRGGRPYAREYHSSAHIISSPSEGQFVHRNDPNLSPREGDWICRNPSCGNLNFARRTYCNNCDKYRYDEPYGTSRSPRKGYVSPPPHRSFSPKLPVSPIDRGPRRDFNAYRSPPPPPRGWDSDDPREFNTNLIPPRRGGKFLDPVRRGRPDFHKDSFRERGRSDWPANGDYDRRDRNAFIPESRANRLPLSPHDHWIRDTRDRSRSPPLPPVGGRLSRGSFVGRNRIDRRYDEPYVRNGQPDDLDMAHGRGYRHGGGRGRSPDVF